VIRRPHQPSFAEPICGKQHHLKVEFLRRARANNLDRQTAVRPISQYFGNSKRVLLSDILCLTLPPGFSTVQLVNRNCAALVREA
jgi:hypothetical protein